MIPVIEMEFRNVDLFWKDLIKLKNLTVSNTVKIKAESNLPNFHKSIFERANIEPEQW